MWYRISGSTGDIPFNRLVNAQSGELREFIEAAEVLEIAQHSLSASGELITVEQVDEATQGGEYRGRQLPLWRVSFSEPENLNLYIDGWTGEIVAQTHHTRWRIFDFFWMLHIMDFDDRDDFNTPLLQIAAALGLLVAPFRPDFLDNDNPPVSQEEVGDCLMFEFGRASHSISRTFAPRSPPCLISRKGLVGVFQGGMW